MVLSGGMGGWGLNVIKYKVSNIIVLRNIVMGLDVLNSKLSTVYNTRIPIELKHNIF